MQPLSLGFRALAQVLISSSILLAANTKAEDQSSAWQKMDFRNNGFNFGRPACRFYFANKYDVALEVYQDSSYRCVVDGSFGVKFAGYYNPSGGMIYNYDEIVAALNKAVEWAEIAAREKPPSFNKTIATFPINAPGGQGTTGSVTFRWQSSAGQSFAQFDGERGDFDFLTGSIETDQIGSLVRLLNLLPEMHNAFRAKIDAHGAKETNDKKAIDQLFR